jgi:hypothetical protein
MKLLTFISGAFFLIASSSCSTYKSGTVSESDDRYYSLSDANKERRTASKLVSNANQNQASNQNQNQNQNQNSDTPANSQDESGYRQYPDASNYSQNQPNTGGNITNNYYGDDYDMDDYYDYMYSSRIRRFHRNNFTGMGYYNPFYTNTYFYNNDPMFFGNSIYSSYGFFNPYVPWGFGGSGLNFGWNSFSGFNFGFGYNPYSMFNNPWRWNSWGYNPWSSPFGYNPWGYNPWGYYGMNQMFGCSNIFMFNNMMNTPIYYNSYDNNTFVNTVNNFGPNQPGAGGGTFYKSDDQISSVFGKEIGQSVSASLGSVKEPIAPGKNTNSSQGLSGKQGKDNIQNSVNPTEVVATPVKGQDAPGKVEPSVKPGKADNFTTAPVKENVPVKNQPGTVAPTAGKNNAADKYTSVPKPSQNVTSQSGKQDLINSGVIRNDQVPNKPTSASNYSSAPVNQPKERSDNNPGLNRPANISPIQETPAFRDQQPTPIRSQQQLNEMPRIQQGVRPETPRNNSNNAGVRDNNQVQPNQNPSRNNYQQYEAPRNNQQYEAPRNNQQPRNYQQYEAPRNNQEPRNNQQYEAPRNNQQPRNYQQYEAPRNNQQPRNYQQPRKNEQYQQPSRNNYQAPSNRYQSAPKSSPRNEYRSPSRSNYNSSPRIESPRQSSSPSRSSSGGSFNNGNSRSSGSSGSRNSSPRK